MSVLRSIRFPNELLAGLLAEAQALSIPLNALVIARLTDRTPVAKAATRAPSPPATLKALTKAKPQALPAKKRLIGFDPMTGKPLYG